MVLVISTVISLRENNTSNGLIYELSGGIVDMLEVVTDALHIRELFQKAKYDSSDMRNRATNALAILTKYRSTTLGKYRDTLECNQKYSLKCIPEEAERNQAFEELQKLLVHVNSVIGVMPIIHFGKTERRLKSRYTLSEVKPRSGDHKESLDDMGCIPLNGQ